MNQIFHGKSACSGVAIGKIYYHDTKMPRAEFKESVPETEKERLDAAIIVCGEQLSELYDTAIGKVGESEAQIFSAHLAISKDEGFKRRIVAIIDGQKANAEYAVHQVAEDYAVMFEQMNDEYMMERAADMRAVGSRIIDVLSGNTRNRIALTEPVILLAEDLTPGDTIRLDKRYILGFVTEKGGMNSHTAILARAMGIPAIVGAKLPKSECHGLRACLDGFTGNLILEPDAYTIERLRAKQAEWLGMQREKYAALQHDINYWVNASSVAEVAYAAQFEKVKGIGLFRTEFLFMGRTSAPDEEEQFESYRDALIAMGGRPIVFRLADLGGDKSEPYMEIPMEENPAMGMRGVRYLLSHQKLLRTQLRALCRASVYGEMRILIPMVTSPEEVSAISDWVLRVKNELMAEGAAVAERTLIGAMIETPAAALLARSLCRYADFFSIGTNDLTQYTLAADRMTVFSEEKGAAWEMALSNPRHPAVLKLIELAAIAANEEGVPVCVCGELASDEQVTDLFKQMGIHSLSISGSILGAAYLQ